MTDISSIVNVQISRQTRAPSRVGFGTGAFVSNDAVFQENIKKYATLAEVNEDSLAGADAKRAAASYFGQTLAPAAFYIIKKGRDLPHVQTLTFDADFVAGNTIDLDINTVAITQVPFDTDHPTTIANLATQIQASAAVATATVNASNNRQIIITGATNNQLVALANLVVAGGASQPAGTIATTQYPDEVQTLTETITRAQNDDDDWYAIGIYSRVEADVLEVAAIINAQLKLFGTASADSDVKGTSTTDIASQLKDLQYTKVFGIYSEVADGTTGDTYPEMGYLGGQLPDDPGSITWKFKPIAGTPVSKLTTTEVNNVLGKNFNVYTEIAGVAFAQEGTVVNGEFIDTIRGTDFIQTRIAEEVFASLVNEKKVPYTNAGIALLENKVDQVLRLSTNQGILAADPAYTITTVPVSQVSQVDKANRTYKGLSFRGTYAGAVHSTEIEGLLVV